jgi:hypothetical protein
MSAPVPSTRRLAIAIGTAATATTLAIGVTAASLLGWFAPSTGPAQEPETSMPAPAASPPVILVPITPTSAPTGEVQLAMEDGDRGRPTDDRDHEDHDRDHEDEDDHDDD